MDRINRSAIWIHNEGRLLEIFAGDKLITDVNTGLCDMNYSLDVLETLGYEIIYDNYSVSPMQKEEEVFADDQKFNMQEKTGTIGILKADLDRDGEHFYADWTVCSNEKDTSSFKKELYRVINGLRCEGNVLYSRGALAKYCYMNQTYKCKNGREYGIRVDSGNYSFLLRLNPHKGEHNVHCNCYEKNELDHHIEEYRRKKNREVER